MITDSDIRNPELRRLCSYAKELISHKEYQECADVIRKAMADYPHAPQPHNLLGLLLEQTGDHPGAMKHFRAAWALDPTYEPAGQNLTSYGTFYGRGAAVYDEEGPVEEDPDPFEYHVCGFGRAARRKHA